MKLTQEEWFKRGKKLHPPEVEPGKWQCPRCKGNGEVGCSSCGEERVCPSCNGVGTFDTPGKAREAGG